MPIENSTGWAYGFAGSSDRAHKSIESVMLSGTETIMVIDGERCTGRRRLYREFALATNFQGHMWDNWDAFGDMLFETISRVGPRPVLVFKNVHQMMTTPSSLEDRDTLLGYLRALIDDANCQYSADTERYRNPMAYVVFHAPQPAWPETLAWLRECCVEPTMIEFKATERFTA